MARPYTVLVADDDPQVLAVVADILREPGYAVVTASDGYSAIRILADRHVDLMLTDIRTPGFDGGELGQQAKLMRPRLHVIYITAYAEQSRKLKGKVLEKPVRAADLVEAVKNEMADIP